jgi:hypothetical protein
MSTGRNSTRRRVAITSQAAKTTRVSRFVFTPLPAGPLTRDSGTLTASFPPERVVMRKGQKVSIYDGGAATTAL